MSVEDEVELKDLLMQTLTENGCISKIKAQLRASVFLALEEDIKLNSQQPLLNNKVKSCLSTLEGQLMFCIVKEFLEYFNLQSTMAVFDEESYVGICYQYNGRTKLSEKLDLKEDHTGPLLQQILQVHQEKPKLLEGNLNIEEKKSEVINNISSISEHSVKTESNLNEEFSDSSSNSSTNMKENERNINIENTSTDNINLMYENQHESVANLNKTFTTESSATLTNFLGSIIDKENVLGNSISIEEIYPKHILSLTEKADEVTAPVLKDVKLSPEKVKSPPKSDKFKSKNSLNSLSDLPPLNITKPRPGKIISSLYGREYKEKSNS